MQFSAHLDDLDKKHKVPHKKGNKSANKKEKDHYKLHIPHQEEKKQVSTHHQKTTPQKTTQNKPKHPKQASKSQENWQNIKEVLIRVLASVFIFIIGYVAMNWSAISIILDSRIKEWQGIDVSEPYKHLAEDTKTTTENKEIDIEIKNNPEEQKRQIPALNLDVTPPDMRVIIPKIGSNVPVVPVPTANLIARDWGALENDIQYSLRDGVVHYPGTAYPDQLGNVVLTGHSSYFPWDPGRFKDVFALLHQVELKDKIVMFYEQKKYIYQVDEIKVVLPDKIDVLGPTEDSRLTLITCTPIGTNEKRLILRAKLIEGELADGTKVTAL